MAKNSASSEHRRTWTPESIHDQIRNFEILIGRAPGPMDFGRREVFDENGNAIHLPTLSEIRNILAVPKGRSAYEYAMKLAGYSNESIDQATRYGLNAIRAPQPGGRRDMRKKRSPSGRSLEPKMPRFKKTPKELSEGSRQPPRERDARQEDVPKMWPRQNPRDAKVVPLKAKKDWGDRPDKKPSP